MNALVFAAGFGTRLKPFTEKFPKPLVPVNGIPLVLYILAFLKKNGITNVVMNLHHLGEKIPELLGDGKNLGIDIRYSREEKILGTGGGLKKALDLLDDDFLIVNGDVIADFDLKALIEQHRQSQNEITMALCHPEDPDRFGHGRIYYRGEKMTSMIGHPEPAKEDGAGIYASYHMVNKARVKPRLDSLPADEAFCVIRKVYVPDILEGKNFGARVITGFWEVCDSLRDVTIAEKKMAMPGSVLSYVAELRELASCLKSNPLYASILAEK